MLTTWVTNISELVKTVTLDDKEYLVCPVVMITECVANGLLYPAEELSNHPEKWNGRPVVVDHPEFNGYAVSANTPQLFQSQTVGIIFNTFFDAIDRKLRAEVWLDKEKTGKVAPEILEKLEKNENIEVSTGLLLTATDEKGVFNGDEYNGVAYNYHPDHLALLPNGIGACSWEDGAGMPRVNKAKRPKDIGSRVLEMAMNAKRMSNEMSIGDKMRAVCSAFEWYSNDESVYVDEVFDSSVIYTHRKDSEYKQYRQSYEMKNGKISPTGDPVEVQRQVEYVPVANEKAKELQTNKKEKEKKMDREKIVSALIANEKTGFTDNHREFLDSLTDEQLTTLSDNAPEVEIPDPVSANENEPEQEIEDVLAAIPEQYRDVLNDSMRMYNEARESAINVIVGNAKGVTKEGLSKLPRTDLDALKAAFEKKADVNFSGRATNRTQVKEPVLPTLGIPNYTKQENK